MAGPTVLWCRLSGDHGHAGDTLSRSSLLRPMAVNTPTGVPDLVVNSQVNSPVFASSQSNRSTVTCAVVMPSSSVMPGLSDRNSPSASQEPLISTPGTGSPLLSVSLRLSLTGVGPWNMSTKREGLTDSTWPPGGMIVTVSWASPTKNTTSTLSWSDTRPWLPSRALRQPLLPVAFLVVQVSLKGTPSRLMALLGAPPETAAEMSWLVTGAPIPSRRQMVTMLSWLPPIWFGVTVRTSGETAGKTMLSTAATVSSSSPVLAAVPCVHATMGRPMALIGYVSLTLVRPSSSRRPAASTVPMRERPIVQGIWAPSSTLAPV